MSFPWKHALRDAAVVAATLAVWRIEGGGTATAVGAGVLAALCGYLVHEWGHLGGAWLSGSVVHLPESVFSTFLFHYDSDRNRREQFLAMSCAGFVATGLVVALFVAVLPLDSLAGRVALGLTALGVLATVVLEFPPAWRVLRGGSIPRGVAYHSEAGAPPP